MSATLPASTLPLRGDTDMTDKTGREAAELADDLYVTQQERDRAEATVSALRKQLDEARECEAQMASALRFYADPQNWEPVYDRQFGRYVSPMDDGKRARAALSQEPPASHAPGLRDSVIEECANVVKRELEWDCDPKGLDDVLAALRALKGAP